MKIKHSSSLQAPDTNHPISRVELVSWSPNGSKIAACLAISNQIILFDGATNEKKDKFGLKSVDKNFSRKSFVVKGLCFSPDSTKIAIAQTDCVIYVYKIGENWEEKKSILARYPLPSPVTCTHWHNFGIVFGLADGKVKLIPNNANRMISLVSHNSMVTSISIAGDYIAAAYLNGAIFLASIGQRESTSFQVMNHTSAPFGLALSTTGYLCVCGTGGKIVFNQLAGQSSRNILNKQVVEYGAEVSGAYAFPSGHSIAIISLNKIIIFTLESSMWKQSQIIELTGTALLTCLTIAKDGTMLIVGTISGAIEVFECQWKKKLIDDRFEINYVGPNQVVIKDTKTSNSTVYRSDFEVKDVKIVREKFAIIWTTSTLILANTQDPEKMSEIEWSGLAHSGVKFSFDYENVVLIRGIGELFLVEFGKNHILASVRSDFFNPHLMSVQINLRKSGAKMLAYLLDMKTVAVIDLVSGIQICSWSNDEKIEWLEMNETGKRLLFKDKSSRLQCLDILTHENSVMLNYCQGVRWVPGSDVVVAQSRDKLYVWYNLMKPVIHDIVGDQRSDMIDIKRENGKTRVVFNGGGQDIVLDEMLIEFDTSLEDGDLRRAMSFLESCDFNVESESMWRTLAEVALKSSDIFVAERAFAAIGDVTKAHFIRQCFNDETKLALLENDWTMFESNNSIDDVVATYLSLHKWEKAIEVAIRVGRSDLRDDLERKYFEYLLASGQHAEAGLLMEKKGNHEDAIRMYIKSGQFIQAAHLIFDLVTKQNFHLNHSVVEELIRELRNSQFMEEAGKLCQIPPISDTTRAFELFVEGKCYPKAIELARHEFPEEVVKLEEQYGDWLMAEGHDPSSAMVHFVEAGKIEKALEAAISANQYDKASELASILDHVPAHLGKMIAEHYASIGRIDAAQDMYLSCGCIQDAITLLNDHNQYQRAYKLARKYMDSDAAREMYENMAQNMEKSGNLKEAERIYLTCSNIDAAIGMYKSHKKYDSMMKLVKQYHPDLVVDTNTHLAKELENSGQLHQAETHYIAASDWKSAVRMYKNNDNWEDAYRVARTYGGAVPAKQVAYMWAKSLPQIDDSVKLLARLGLLNQVVDYAVECNAYEFAKNLVTEAGPELRHKINDVNLKYAYWLENEERFDEAEALYLEANKPKEVVIMYMGIGDFSEALRVAEQYVKDENCVSDILVAQAKSVLEKEGKSIDVMMKAETLLLRAGRIELAVKMYKDFGMWDEALRVCEQYSPSLIDSVKRDMIVSSKMNGSGLGGGGSSTRGNSVISMSDHFSIPDSRRASSRGSSFRHHNRRESINSSIDFDDRRDVRSELEASKVAEDRTGIIRNALTLASQLIGEKSCQEAVKVVTANQVCLSVPEARIILIRLAADLMGFENEPQPMASTWKHLRNCFLQYLTANPASQDEQQIEKYLLISHYLYLREVLSSLTDNHGGKKELLAKLSISLLRYTDIIRVDKFFFEAGKMAKETGRLDMAFILWNHFLDLIDAIEEGEVNVDHSDFVDTDIPSEVPLPSRPYSIESEPNLVEDVKSWILHMSMDSRSTRSLPKDSHGYEASLMDKDGTQYLPCLVTGYPVSKQKMLELRPKKYAANKDDWNKLLMLTKVSSSEDLKDVLLFIGKLCGNATITRFTFQ